MNYNGSDNSDVGVTPHHFHRGGDLHHAGWRLIRRIRGWFWTDV